MHSIKVSLKTKNKINNILLKCVKIVFLSGISYLILYPVIYMLIMSFRPLENMLEPDIVWISKGFTTFNIRAAYQMLTADRLGNIIHPFLNSFAINILNTAFQLLVCSLAGYGLARFKFKGNGILFACVCLTIFVPPQSIFLAQYLNFRYFNFFGIGSLAGIFTGAPVTISLVNKPLTFFMITLLGQGLRSGLYILIFRQFFKQLPKELEEVAYIDGSGSTRTFFKIIIPSSMVAFVTVALFSFVFGWNDKYYTDYFMNTVKTVPQAVKDAMNLLEIIDQDINLETYAPMIHKALQGVSYDKNIQKVFVQAACLIALFPPLLLYTFMQKRFVESVDRTGLVE